MRLFLLLGLFSVVVPIGVSADPPAEWKLPEAEGRKWTARVGKAVARDGWTVECRGNEITVRRSKPVAMERAHANAMPNWKPSPDGEMTVRFVLRFAPKMSMDEYERLAAVNTASDKEHDQLKETVRGISHKYDDYIATTPEENERLRKYREAVAKLSRHTLPDLYSPDHSIYLLRPWGGWASPADKQVAAECLDVQDNLVRYFGTYDPAVAARSRGIGQYQSVPRR